MLKLIFWLFMPMMFFMADGDSGTTDPAQNSDDNGNESGDGGEAKIELTQAQLDAMFAPRMQKASEKAQQALLEQLGVEDIEAAKKLMADAEKARKQQMTELEQAQEAARVAAEEKAKAIAQAEQRESLANERLMQSALLAEASKPDYKLRNEALKDLWLFVTNGLKEKLTVQEDGTVEGIADVLKEIIKDRDYWLITDDTVPGTTTRQKRQQMQQRATQPIEQPENYVPTIRF